MTIKELNTILKILAKIKNSDSYVTEAVHLINRDIARLEQRAKKQRENNEMGYETW